MPWIEGPLSHGLKLLKDGVFRALTIVSAPRKHSRRIHSQTVTDDDARLDDLQNSIRTALRRNFSTHDVDDPFSSRCHCQGGDSCRPTALPHSTSLQFRDQPIRRTPSPPYSIACTARRGQIAAARH